MNWVEKVEALRASLGRKPNLNELLDLARTYTMNAEEKEAQRESWVVGELMWQHPDMTRDEAVRRYRRAKMELVK